MTERSHKISVRIEARLYDQLQALVDVHPHRSRTAVIEKLITAGLSQGSPVKARAYLQSAVANVAVILGLLREHDNADAKAIKLICQIYGILLELLIEIEGVEP